MLNAKWTENTISEEEKNTSNVNSCLKVSIQKP